MRLRRGTTPPWPWPACRPWPIWPFITLNHVLPELGKPFGELRPDTQQWIATVTILSGGFIVTSLLWGTILTHLIDGRVRPAAATLVLAGIFAWFGIIHSPLPSGEINAPWVVLQELAQQGPRPGVGTADALSLGRGVRGDGDHRSPSGPVRPSPDDR